MTYRDDLRPWAIFEHLPNGKSKCVYRFRTRTEADCFTTLLKQGGGSFEVVFDQPQRQEVTQG